MVYLLHFARETAAKRHRPISPRHTTQHYMGWTDDLPARLQMHAKGNGARLVQVAAERGIGFTLVRVWPGGRNRERQIKRWKMGPRLCPICQKRHWHPPLEQDIDFYSTCIAGA